MAAKRRIWRVAQRFIDPDRLVFIDETGASTKMTRLYGRAPHGQRVIASAPFGHWKTTTVVAALRRTGLTAPMVLDGPMTGPAFLAYVQQVLVPTLEPGDIVVLDNLSAHRIGDVRAAIRAAGASSSCCRPIRPTSTRSRWPSPRSKPCSAKSPREPSTASGAASASFSTASRRTNAPTTSKLPDMETHCENALAPRCVPVAS